MKYLFTLLLLTACTQPFDFTPAPKAPIVQSGPASATLTWDANTEADLAGYKVYYSTIKDDFTQNAPIVLGLVTTYTIQNLARGVKYYFTLTAFDTSGNESEPSQTWEKEIPL